MEAIKIPAKDDTPSIILDPETGKFEIAGKSMPEDVAAFYQPVLNWLDENADLIKDKMFFDFKLVYFNTASSKILLDIMIKLEELYNSGKDITIRWFYPEDDEDMQEAGEEYAEMVEVPFEQVAY